MGTTIVRICNAALANIGNRQFITDIEEDTAEAQACNALYESKRDLVLASHPWRFATRRATLAVVADVTREGWGYVYALPSDFLELIQLAPESRNPYPSSRMAFATELNDAGDGLLLLADDGNGNISYIAQVDSPIVYPAYFAEAISWLLASELAVALAVKDSLAQNALKRFQISLSQAKAKDGAMGFEPEPDSEIISVRS